MCARSHSAFESTLNSTIVSYRNRSLLYLEVGYENWLLQPTAVRWCRCSSVRRQSSKSQLCMTTMTADHSLQSGRVSRLWSRPDSAVVVTWRQCDDNSHVSSAQTGETVLCACAAIIPSHVDQSATATATVTSATARLHGDLTIRTGHSVFSLKYMFFCRQFWKY